MAALFKRLNINYSLTSPNLARYSVSTVG